MTDCIIFNISGSRDLNRLNVVHEAVVDDVYAHVVVNDLVAAARLPQSLFFSALLLLAYYFLFFVDWSRFLVGRRFGVLLWITRGLIVC
jgi:hypothetical protein